MISPQHTPSLQVRRVDILEERATLAAFAAIDIMGAVPTLRRAVLLVPRSATPLLGSSHCLCQKPLVVEPCQNVNLKVHALLVGNAERQ